MAKREKIYIFCLLNFILGIYYYSTIHIYGRYEKHVGKEIAGEKNVQAKSFPRIQTQQKCNHTFFFFTEKGNTAGKYI